MKRYLNLVRGNWQVGKRPTKKTLGGADIPSLDIAYNQFVALVEHFISEGLIYWTIDYDMFWRKKGDYRLVLTDKGHKVMFGK